MRHRRFFWFPIFLGLILLMFFSGNPMVHAQEVSRTVSMQNQQIATLSPDEIIGRARKWLSPRVAYDPYGPHNPDGYRKDCSGFVSMAWGLPVPGLDTSGLAQVTDQITPNQLREGDALLNTGSDAHVILFVGWVDNGKTVNYPTSHYDGIEENGDTADGYGFTVEHTPDNPWPYPYYPGYDSAGYVPVRFDPLKAAHYNYGTNVSSLPTAPTVAWVSPANGITVTSTIHFSATVKEGSSDITLVNFTIESGGIWQVGCAVHLPAEGNTFTCDVNLPQLGVGYGQLKVSCDVVDSEGNHFNGLPGERTVNRVPIPGQTPAQPQPTPTQAVLGASTQATPTPANIPVAQPTSQPAQPTAPPVSVVPTPTPIPVIPTPIPPTPTPVPPTPTPVPSNLPSGGYTGTIADMPSGQTSTMVIDFTTVTSTTISGHITIDNGGSVYASGFFSGTIANGFMVFSLQSESTGALVDIRFTGNVNADHSLSGSYSANSGHNSGAWSVTPGD